MKKEKQKLIDAFRSISKNNTSKELYYSWCKKAMALMAFDFEQKDGLPEEMFREGIQKLSAGEQVAMCIRYLGMKP